MRRRLRAFLTTEAAGGMVMIGAAVIALLLANSPLSVSYTNFIDAPLLAGLSVSAFTKDVLMAIFFFAVGMELKCEMREGALSAPGQKLLPLVAALGGIVIPALLYLALTGFDPALRGGWAIPTATDIAFALCVLRLAGPALPTAAKAFLLAIAIYDDLAAIIIVALFYTGGLILTPLLASGAIIALMMFLNHRHVASAALYLALGAALWFALHETGIHPTVAGVVTGILIPLRARDGAPLLAPLLHTLHPYVAFIILPLFAFTAAGVDVRGLTFADATSPLPMAIALSLFIGKQIGIFGATLAAVKIGLAPLPTRVRGREVYGVAIIAGIGFTMSLFIGQLAYAGAHGLEAVKLGVLAGSVASAAWGLIYLRARGQRP